MLVVDQLKKGDQPLRVLALVVLVGLAILLVGLAYVQVFSSRRYKASQVSQSFRTVRLPAIRGRIFDAAGRPLADNRPAYNVNLYLEELRTGFQEAFKQRTEGQRLSRDQRNTLGAQTRYWVASNLVAQATAALGNPVVLDPDNFQKHYDQRRALPLPVSTDLPLPQVARFVEGASGLPGFELEVQPMRYYPNATAAAHLLGHLRRNDRPEAEDLFARYSLPDYAGANGLEAFFDVSLRGRAGVKSVLVNNLGYRESENIWAPAEAGENVVLTLNLEIQQAAEQALRANGARTRGAIVVMDVLSGDLLALASSPAFDPNEFVPRLRPEVWASYTNETLLPLLNRATMGMYAPGSIFKVVTGLAALEAGILDPQRVYSSPGFYQLGNRRIRDLAYNGQPADFNFRKAFAKSSNAYFIHYGLLAGLDRIVALGQRLHLGEKSGLPLPLGQENPGIFPTPEYREDRLGGEWHEGDTANLSIGQGKIAVTPIQMAVMTAAIANGGQVLWPRLISRIEPQEPARRSEGYAFPGGRVRNSLGVSDRSLRTIRDAMLADVEDKEGTGTGARIEDYRVCGKTGTAEVQHLNPRREDQITWFASFAPYERPRYAVVVMIESGVSGGSTCAPIARQVYLALRNLSQPPLAAANPRPRPLQPE